MNSDPPAEKLPSVTTRPGANPNTPKPHDSTTPPHVPDHELLKCIGRGSYGEVWLARNVMGTYRAVKVVYRTSFEHDRPFEREFDGIRKFEPISRTHESQVDILHVGRDEQGGYFYYVMELADAAEPQPSDQCSVISNQPEKSSAGQPPSSSLNTDNTDHCLLITSYTPRTLRSDLLHRGRLPLEECLQIGLSLTTALDHLHKHGLVHRDVKPSNIIFVNGIPKLADIGLVASLDATMSFVGTAGYLPPEGPGTPQADLYSLGKVLYELCTGRDRQNFPELPTEWEEFVDQQGLLELNAVLMKACESDARKRYQSAQEMHADLALLQTGKSVKRLRVIEHRLVLITRIGLGAGASALIAVAAYFGAVRQAHRARRAEREMAQQLYVSDVNRAYQLWEKGDLKRALELLEAHRPLSHSALRIPHSAFGEDPRGFEWFYLWQRCHRDDALDTFRACTNGFVSSDFSPDCAILATANSKGPLVLWDIPSRQPLANLTNYDGEQVWAFSRDGKTLAYGTVTGSIQLWDVGTKRAAVTLPGAGRRCYSLAFSHDGLLLATLETESTVVRLWDVGSRRVVNTLRSDDGGYVYGVAFSSDGKILAAGHRDNIVTLWNAASSEKMADVEVPMGFAGNLTFSPDNRALAVAGNNSTVALCEVASRKIVGALLGHERQISCVAFSPDGRTVATGSVDNTVRLWDWTSRQALATFKGHLDRITAVAYSTDGKTLASAAADGTMKLWDTGRKTNPDVLIGHSDWARSVAFSPDSRMLASAGKDKTVKLWDTTTGGLVCTLLGHQRPVYRLAWSSDIRTLATVSGLATEENNLGEVKLWDTVDRKELVTLTNQNNAVFSVAFTPDGQTLATGNGNGSIALWNVVARQQAARLVGHTNQMQGLAFSPDGKLLATGGHDNTVRLWDVATRRQLAVFPGSPGNQQGGQFKIWCVAFSDDGKTLAVGNDDGTVQLWSVGSRKLSGAIKGTAGKVYGIAFSPDEKTLATASQDNAVTLWHLATGQELAVLKGHRNMVESVAFSPDGTLLASASADKTVRLWRAATRAETDTRMDAK